MYAYVNLTSFRTFLPQFCKISYNRTTYFACWSMNYNELDNYTQRSVLHHALCFYPLSA